MPRSFDQPSVLAVLERKFGPVVAIAHAPEHSSDRVWTDKRVSLAMQMPGKRERAPARERIAQIARGDRESMGKHGAPFLIDERRPAGAFAHRKALEAETFVVFDP